MAQTIPIYSFSQLNTWDRCHFAWNLNYLQEWHSLETRTYFQEGTVGHDLLMIYYKNIPLTSHENCVKLVKQRVGQYIASVGMDKEKLEVVSTMARVVRDYLEKFARIEDQKWDIRDAEKEFEIPLISPKGRHFIFQLILDVLARERSTGRLHIWDHKFVGRGRFISIESLLMDNQIPAYAGILQIAGIPIFGGMMNQINKHEYANPAERVPENLFKRVPLLYTESELHSRLLEIGRTVDEVEDAKEAGVFRRSLKQECENCFWHVPCLKGLKSPSTPVELLMGPGFEKKTPKKALI